MTALYIILGIAVLIILYVISLQRKLVGLGERRENALSSIGVQQQSRWDALTQLAKTVKSYAGHEADTLMNVIGQRSGSMPKTAADVEANDKTFASAMRQVSLVVEQYPNLKADSLYSNLMNDINGYENNVRMARMVFNDTTTKLNQAVKVFPASLFAGMLGYKAEEYIQTPDEKTEMPNLDI